MPAIFEGWSAELVDPSHQLNTRIELRGRGWTFEDLLLHLKGSPLAEQLSNHSDTRLVIKQITRAPSQED
jgi:hypothetical protein